MPAYPASRRDRDGFVLGLRGPRPRLDAWRYQRLLVEDERTGTGSIARGAVVFLTGRECPWRCVMCDLWQHTLAEETPAGAIPAQIAAARHALISEQPSIRYLKLYNASNFFDPRAVPDEDYAAIARELARLDRIVVESHPSLVGPRLDRFLEALSLEGAAAPQLEVAMGLETANPHALERLNKQMTEDDFARAAGTLRARGVDVRAFLLVSPPFVAAGEQDAWLLRSIDAAFSHGAAVVSLVPTRAGNGAMEALARDGAFHPPTLDDIERSVRLARERFANRGQIFVDLWDLERFGGCPACVESRREALRTFNLTGSSPRRVTCAACGGGGSPS